MASFKVGSLGDYLREQRRNAQLSLRQLAEAAGVSNPYLSQIERGLRRPSAEILQQIAKGLRISAETLYVRAGILDERDGGLEVTSAILADGSINERQRQVLIDIYEAFRSENATAQGRPGHPDGREPGEPLEQSASPSQGISGAFPAHESPGLLEGLPLGLVPPSPEQTTSNSPRKEEHVDQE